MVSEVTSYFLDVDLVVRNIHEPCFKLDDISKTRIHVFCLGKRRHYILMKSYDFDVSVRTCVTTFENTDSVGVENFTGVMTGHVILNDYRTIQSHVSRGTLNDRDVQASALRKCAVCCSRRVSEFPS